MVLEENDILVSVWMITYNHEKYISDALDSVLSQKVNFNFEIVIGDDHSLDQTTQILKDYQKNNPKLIKLILQKKNVGMIANQNVTFKACRGKYIAMLEGDDFWTDPNKLQMQVEMMLKNPACHLSFHPVNETKHGRILSRHSFRNKIFSVRNVIKGGGYYCPTASLMLNRAVVEQLPRFLCEAPAGDYYLQILGSINGGALYINKVMATYRIESEGSWSELVKKHSARILFKKETIKILDLLNSHLNFKFNKEINNRQLLILLMIAYDYLLEEEYDKFLTTIIEAKNKQKNFSLEFCTMYLLKNNPKLIIIINQTRNGVISVPKLILPFVRKCLRWVQ